MMIFLTSDKKNVYKEFCSYKLTPPTAKAKSTSFPVLFPQKMGGAGKALGTRLKPNGKTN